VATLGDFRVINIIIQKAKFALLAFRDPDVHNRNLRIAHALGGEIDGVCVCVLFFETLGFSERSGVVLSEDARDGTSKCIIDLE